MEFYALKTPKKLDFLAISMTEEDFKAKVNQAYSYWRACQSKGAPEETKTREAFLEEIRGVKKEYRGLKPMDTKKNIGRS